MTLLGSHNYEFESKTDVHAKTLQAFAKERLKDGKKIDLEALGLYAGTTAKITAPK